MDRRSPAFIEANERCGRHANIPACCIAAYCADILRGIEEIGDRRQEQCGVPSWFPAVGYVPCPSCYRGILAGTVLPAVIHQCDDTDEECTRVQSAYDVFFPAETAALGRAINLQNDAAKEMTATFARELDRIRLATFGPNGTRADALELM